MKKLQRFLIVLILVGIALFCEISLATAAHLVRTKSFELTVFTTALRGETRIHLIIQDAKPKGGVCPYFLKSFQYIKALKLISVDLFQDNCANDQFGVSRGEVSWNVPTSLLHSDVTLPLVINDEKVGSLIYHDSEKYFEVREDLE